MIKIMGKIIRCTRGDTLRVRITPLKDADMDAVPLKRLNALAARVAALEQKLNAGTS
jgi:hypothetical protein